MGLGTGSISQDLGSRGRAGTISCLLSLCNAPLPSLSPQPASPVTCPAVHPVCSVSRRQSESWSTGKCHFPLHPKSCDLAPVSRLYPPPRTVSFSSTDQIPLKTSPISSSLDAFGIFPSDGLLPASPLPASPVLSVLGSPSLVSSP